MDCPVKIVPSSRASLQITPYLRSGMLTRPASACPSTALAGHFGSHPTQRLTRDSQRHNIDPVAPVQFFEAGTRFFGRFRSPGRIQSQAGIAAEFGCERRVISMAGPNTLTFTESRQRIRRQAQSGQGGYRQSPAALESIWRSEHSDRDRLSQGRRDQAARGDPAEIRIQDRARRRLGRLEILRSSGRGSAYLGRCLPTKHPVGRPRRIGNFRR